MTQTLLIVDDEPAVLDGLTHVLRKHPYQILTATSAQQALEILAATPVDVVIADEVMPGKRGTALLKEVREYYPDTVRFMLTGKATLSVALDAINEGGVSRFFLKPCDNVELTIAIRQELEKRDLLIAARRLLGKVKGQSALLDRLEEEYPSITEVRRDADGAVLLDDFSGDLPTLVSEIYKQLDGESHTSEKNN